jgi:hypothetical protein
VLGPRRAHLDLVEQDTGLLPMGTRFVMVPPRLEAWSATNLAKAPGLLRRRVLLDQAVRLATTSAMMHGHHLRLALSKYPVTIGILSGIPRLESLESLKSRLFLARSWPVGALVT